MVAHGLLDNFSVVILTFSRPALHAASEQPYAVPAGQLIVVLILSLKSVEWLEREAFVSNFLQRVTRSVQQSCFSVALHIAFI
jgi:hypothetical protein